MRIQHCKEKEQVIAPSLQPIALYSSVCSALHVYTNKEIQILLDDFAVESKLRLNVLGDFAVGSNIRFIII